MILGCFEMAIQLFVLVDYEQNSVHYMQLLRQIWDLKNVFYNIRVDNQNPSDTIL